MPRNKKNIYAGPSYTVQYLYKISRRKLAYNCEDLFDYHPYNGSIALASAKPVGKSPLANMLCPLFENMGRKNTATRLLVRAMSWSSLVATQFFF